MSIDSIDPFDIAVCPITDEGCELWTKACDDESNPVDYSITRDLQNNPLNEDAAHTIGRLCWGRVEGEDTCGLDVMVQVRTGKYEQEAS